MSASFEFKGCREVWSPAVKPLDEAVWQAWLAKGYAREQRNSAFRVKAVKWATAATLLATVGMWSYLAPYEVFVRFAVALGAIVVVFQSFRERQYALAALFGAIVLFYNPVVPVFDFSGGWQRVFVLASAAVFAASLASRSQKAGAH
jgi:hypothetical protein